jgi:hypothetical protein
MIIIEMMVLFMVFLLLFWFFGFYFLIFLKASLFNPSSFHFNNLRLKIASNHPATEVKENSTPGVKKMQIKNAPKGP